MTDTHFDVLYIGNYTKDTIVSPAGTRYVDGGAVNYGAHAGNSLGARAAVITRLAREDERVVQAFRQAGVACYPVYTPSSTIMRLEYPNHDPDERTLSVRDTAGSITPAQLEGLSAQSAVIGSSLRGEVGIDVIRALKAKGITVAADMQGFVRVLNATALEYQPWPEMAEALALVDIVKSDMVEAGHLTGETDLYRAARFYASLGPKEIVLTHRDGVLIYTAEESHEFGFHPAQMIGRSGRGDTCIGSYTALRLHKPPREAGRWAAAVTSLKMEALGPFMRPVADVEAYLRAHPSDDGAAN